MRSERVFQRRVKPNPGGPEDHDERRRGVEGGRKGEESPPSLGG